NSHTRRPLERAGDGLHAPGRGHLRPISLRAASQLRRGVRRNAGLAAHPHRLDHRAGGIAGAHGSIGPAVVHRRGRALRQSGLSGGHDRQTPFSTGTFLIGNSAMHRCAPNASRVSRVVATLVLFAVTPALTPAAASDSPAFSSVPELTQGFHLLYMLEFPEARQVFQTWESANPDQPFGHVALA